MVQLTITILCVLAQVLQTNGFYLPGIAPYSYASGEDVDLKVNKLSSFRTLLPIDYYSLKFCKPVEGVKAYSENLGEFLRGDRIQNSAYDIMMLTEENCRFLCEVNFNGGDVSAFKKAIGNSYHHNWIMDNLPAATLLDDEKFVITEYTGFPIGFVEEDQYYLNNHQNIIIEYHTVGEDQHRIVGFYVEPLSIKHSYSASGPGSNQPLNTCSPYKKVEFEDIKKGFRLKLDTGKTIFTYGVQWRASEVEWASRWDVYLSMNNTAAEQVHWFSIVNSMLIVTFLSFFVAAVLVRAVRRDISSYNSLPTDEEKEEQLNESGWKLVHADVFRPPTTYPMLFCVTVGTGVQLLVSAFILIVCAAIGFVSPANRGSVMITMVLLFVLLGTLSGYTSAVLYKTFKGKEWKLCTTLTATLFSGITFVAFFLLNILEWANGSTAAVPITTMITIVLLWFGISVPMVFLGASWGYKAPAMEFPAVTSNIPREVPDQPFILHPVCTMLIAAILPFGASFVELFFVMSSVWMDQYYYMFGFLFLVFCILSVTTAEVAILGCYFQLCSEDYRWWWRSLLNGGGFSVFVFLYAISFVNKLESTLTPTYVLYFTYNALICTGLFMMTGAIGFISALVFNMQIYGSLKVD